MGFPEIQQSPPSVYTERGCLLSPASIARGKKEGGTVSRPHDYIWNVSATTQTL